MDVGRDRAYLRGIQYATGANLRARQALHECFTTAAVPWYRWVFERLRIPPAASVLEVGCGTGALWAENADRIPPGWRLVLADLSEGMLGEARGRVPGTAVHWIATDAQAVPFRSGGFDAVIANHMLYHVPDRARAISEFRRVLVPNGVLLAATNGPGHLREIDELAAEVLMRPRGNAMLAFNLRDGAAQLQRSFSRVRMESYADALEVTEAAPLVAYVLSMRTGHPASAAQAAALEERVADTIRRTGSFHVTKEVGLFVCRP